MDPIFWTQIGTFVVGLLAVVFRKKLGLGTSPAVPAGFAEISTKLTALVDTLPLDDDTKHLIVAEMIAVLQRFAPAPKASPAISRIEELLGNVMVRLSAIEAAPAK